MAITRTGDEPADLAAGTPTGGHLIGYARTSTSNQLLDRQIKALKAAGCKRIFRDQISGRTAARPGLVKALDQLLDGDERDTAKRGRRGGLTRWMTGAGMGSAGDGYGRVDDDAHVEFGARCGWSR